MLINLRGIFDLMTLNFINELISIYQEKKDDKYLKIAMDQINILRRDKIKMLDNEIFPEALTELQKLSQDDQDYDEKIHVELVHEVNKINAEIKNYDSKSD